MWFWSLILVLTSIFPLINGDASICQLKLDEGGGGDTSLRYFYKLELMRCVPFMYKGGGGNANNFRTLVDCQKKCMDICKLPKASISSDKSEKRIYYDEKDGECKVFMYGGGGNANNFMSRRECSNACICNLTWEFGTGTGSELRYYYDPQLKTCIQKVYSGEGGNANNFKYLLNCASTCDCDRGCTCTQPADPGPGHSFSTWFHLNQKTLRCETFAYGGQGGNLNRFKTKAECISTCGCNLLMDPGKGSKRIERYFYNRRINRCEPFIYYGEEGNANNFLSGLDCKYACVCSQTARSVAFRGYKEYFFNTGDQTCKRYPDGERGTTENTFNSNKECVTACGCSLPKHVGVGYQYVYRFYYDTRTNQCVRFLFRGSSGNINNFQTYLECQSSCACHLPFDIGVGHDSYKRFYYDVTTQQCNHFTFKGQKGNANNFYSYKQCTSVCICSLPKNNGDHGVDYPVYYFNKTSKKCETLSDGYVGGNANRFSSLDGCKKVCLGKKPQKPPQRLRPF